MDATLKKFAPLSGVVFVALYVASTLIAMKGSPQFAAKPEEVLAYYHSHGDKIMLGGVLDIVSTPFWLLFLGSLRSAMGAAEGGAGRLTATAFGAGVAAAATGVSGTVLNVMASIRAGNGTLAEPVATVYFDATNVLAYTATAALISAFTLALGVAALRYGAVLPKWLGVIAIIASIALLWPPISWAVLQLGLILVLWASIATFRSKAGEL
jgi:hypothetical protein